MAFFEVTGAGWDFPERYGRAVEAVTAADVARVARGVPDAPHGGRRATATAGGPVIPLKDDVAKQLVAGGHGRRSSR